MASVYEHLQESFAGGELSPRLKGRVTSDLYKKALATSFNFQPCPGGSLLMRRGTRGVNEIVGGSDLVRLIQFRSSRGQDAVVVLGDQTVAIYGEGAAGVAMGGTVLIGAAEYIVNGDFALGSYGWTLNPNAYVSSGGVVLGTWVAGAGGVNPTPAVFTPGTVSQSFIVPGGTYVFTCRFKYASGGASTNAMTVKAGTTPGGSDLSLQSAGVAGAVYKVNLTAPAGLVYLTFSGPPSYTTPFESFSTPEAPCLVSVSCQGSGGTQASSGTPWTLPMLAAVQWVSEPSGSGDRMVFTHPNAPPQVLAHGPNDAWTWSPAPFVRPPAEWAGTNWPAVCEIYQGRLWLAGTPNEKNQVWASRPGDPFDFSPLTDTTGGLHVPAAAGPITATIVQTPDCSITQRIATKGAITQIRGQRTLLPGTDDGEYSIDGGGGSYTGLGGLITPSDFQARQESAYGSAPIQALSTGSQVLYISSDGRKVRAQRWVHDTNGWESPDVTFVADHITKSQATELHFAREPIATILVLLKDGTIAACTYEQAQEVTAWWRIDVGDPIRSMAVAKGPQGSTLWLAVQRVGGLFLETLPLYESDGDVYLDAAVTGPVPAGLLVNGLLGLRGQAAQVWIDGVRYDDQVPVGDAITLPVSGLAFTLGLPMPLPTAVTLPPEGGEPKGTSQRARRRWVKCALRLYNSALPLVNGNRIAPDRTPSTALDTLEPLTTGDVLTNLTGWNNHGQLTITQDLPLRTEILAIFGSIAVNEL